MKRAVIRFIFNRETCNTQEDKMEREHLIREIFFKADITDSQFKEVAAVMCSGENYEAFSKNVIDLDKERIKKIMDESGIEYEDMTIATYNQPVLSASPDDFDNIINLKGMRMGFAEVYKFHDMDKVDLFFEVDRGKRAQIGKTTCEKFYEIFTLKTNDIPRTTNCASKIVNDFSSMEDKPEHKANLKVEYKIMSQPILAECKEDVLHSIIEKSWTTYSNSPLPILKNGEREKEFLFDCDSILRYDSLSLDKTIPEKMEKILQTAE